MRWFGIEEADSDAGQQAGTVFPLVKEGKQVSAKRLSMRTIKEVLRLKFELGFGHRQIASTRRSGPHASVSASQRVCRGHA